MVFENQRKKKAGSVSPSCPRMLVKKKKKGGGKTRENAGGTLQRRRGNKEGTFSYPRAMGEKREKKKEPKGLSFDGKK